MDATNAVILEPWTAVNRILIQRAVDRGEISQDVDIEKLFQVIPSMSGYRTVILRKSVDQQFLTAMIDNVLLCSIKPSGISSPTDRFASLGPIPRTYSRSDTHDNGRVLTFTETASVPTRSSYQQIRITRGTAISSGSV